MDVIIEQIHRAWGGGKVLSLVTFDVHRALDGVYSWIVCKRMEQRQILAQHVRCVYGYCSDRTTSMVVGHYTSDTMHIHP
jgi:hypothetical protein